MQNRARRSEMMTGYLMVLPALLIICAISVYPILRTVYFSLFDYQLNNPAKRQIQTRAQFDLEKYVDASFYLNSSLKKLIKKVDPEQAAALQAIQAQIQDADAQLRQAGDVAGKYDQVEATVNAMKRVDDEQLKYASLTDVETAQLSDALKDISAQLYALREDDGDDYAQLVGMVKDLQDCLLSPNFIGLRNYQAMAGELGKTESGEIDHLARALMNTLGFTIITVLSELILGMAVAHLANRELRGRGMIRALMLVPWAIPTAVSSLMWRYMFDGQTGVMALLLTNLGLFGSTGELLGTPVGAAFSVILTDVWKTTPYMALLILAGLQLIPGQLYESSEIDGASRWQQFRNVTLPMLRSTLMVALLFRTLDAFRVFDLVSVMTKGGPGYATESLSLYAYKTMFSQMNFGKGSALAVLLFVCVALISLLYIKLLGANLTDRE